MEHKQSAPSSNDKHITIKIEGNVVDALVVMAQRDQSDIAHLLANALHNHDFIQSIRLSGKKLFVQEPNGVLVPVVFGSVQPSPAAVPSTPVPVVPTAAKPVAPAIKPASATTTPSASATATAPVAESAPLPSKAL